MENPKYGNIKKIIHFGFLLDEKFSIFQESNNYNHAEIERIYKKIVSPYNDELELIKDIQFLEEFSCYSYKRIYLPKGDNEILFCCSSMSPKKVDSEKKSQNTLDSPISEKTCESSITSKKSTRNLKRENCNSCPMRLKFKREESSNLYQITEDSNFNHNHSAISNCLEVFNIINSCIYIFI